MFRFLEKYRLPKDLFKQGYRYNNRHFIDREEMPLSGNSLNSILCEKLAKSQYLLLIWSEQTKDAKWVAAEIEEFIHLGRANEIFALVVSGIESLNQKFPSIQNIFDISTGNKLQKKASIKKAILSIIAVFTGVNQDKLFHSEQVRSYGRSVFRGITILLFSGLVLLYSISRLNSTRSNLEEANFEKTNLVQNIQELTFNLYESLLDTDYPADFIICDMYRKNLETLDAIEQLNVGIDDDFINTKFANCIQYGDYSFFINEIENAENAYRESIDLAYRLLEGNPDEDLAKTNVAMGFQRLAFICDLKGDTESAVIYYTHSVEYLDSMTDCLPNEVNMYAYYLLGNEMVKAGDIISARDAYQKGIAIKDNLSDEYYNYSVVLERVQMINDQLNALNGN
jgi:tetratricopeptide (TPR) repeat protein